MEFEGIVVQVLQGIKGTSARGEWSKQEVIFEQPGEFGRKICVSFWGDKSQDAAGLVPGEKVRIAANVESREYNGRWYTEVRAWKMDRSAGGAATGAPVPSAAEYDWGAPAGGGVPHQDIQAPQQSVAQDDFDDLPF